jgi:hypothetical protein
VNNLTNKLIGVLKYHKNRQLIKSEIVKFSDDLNVNIAVEELCAWVGDLHVIAQFLFEYKGYNMWVHKVVTDAAMKLLTDGILTHSDEMYTKNAGRLGVVTGFRKVDSEKDGVSCDDKTFCFYIDFAIQSYAADDTETYSMLLIEEDHIKTLNEMEN